jgi:4-aminobutyrate aminotransferase
MLTVKHEGRSAGDNNRNWLGPAPWIETRPPGPQALAVAERASKVGTVLDPGAYLLVPRQASGAVIEDVDGNRYLDFAIGQASCLTGHSHVKVAAAIKAQADQGIDWSGRPALAEARLQLSERLAALAPGDPPRQVLLTDSGAESVEAAIKLARRHTGRPWLAAFHGASHGWTVGGMTLTSSAAIVKQGFGPLMPKVTHLPYGDADVIEETLIGRHIRPADLAAVFFEPVLTEAKFEVGTPAFLQGLRRFCHRHGILLVADEVRTGPGRTGRRWACDHADIVPDILVLGDSLGSGMPLGAVIASRDVLQAYSPSLWRSPGGNPVSCAAATVTLDLVEQAYTANAEGMGRKLCRGLETLAERHRCVGNPRGVGLMAGLDIIKGAGKASPKHRDRILVESFQRGLLLAPIGSRGIRFAPPLCIKEIQIDVAIQVFEEVIETVTP